MKTDYFSAELDDAGQFSTFTDTVAGTQYLPSRQSAPLLILRADGEDQHPIRMAWTEADRVLALHYSSGATAEIVVEIKPSHLTFQLAALSSSRPIELVSWGPYPTTIDQTIGETVGVVRDGDFAIGIQALNAKTMGGRPCDDDVMPSYDIFDGADYADISPDFVDRQLYRGDVAIATEYGSALQAYCRDRSQARVIANWGHEHYLAPPYEDGGVVGSKVALFGCPADRIMQTLETIEIEEGLPHPLIDGEWAKTHRKATAAYVIMDFGQDTIDQAIALTQMAGLEYLYHSAPFETWGHFTLKPDLFPDGWAGFKKCVAKATHAGVKIGFHTLSNFTTTNDAYVTPTPDPRLARVGSSQLSKSVNAQTRTIWIDDPMFFRKKTTLNAVVIGDEIITYDRVSPTAPWKLLRCQRGAFETVPADHAAGDDIGKLMDHGYRVFLTDADLAQEQARRIAAFCNDTGARQLSFDGLEGNWSTGMGQYGRTLFTQAWYEALCPALQGEVINDASNPGHYNWHTYTRMNWGEPWYAGFRESQTLYRLKNQYYYSRNLMPAMLGWFALRGDTSIEDTEWLLARAAGFDAGFALATSIEFAGDQILPGQSVEGRGKQNNISAILAAVKCWESARMAGVIPRALKPELQDVEREFHLTSTDGGWHLFSVCSVKDRLSIRKRTVLFDNDYGPQSLGFSLQNIGTTAIQGLQLMIGAQQHDLCPHPLAPGEILKRTADGQTTIYDANWGILQQLDPEEDITVDTGPQKIRLDWAQRQSGQLLKVEYRTLDEPMRLDSTG